MSQAVKRETLASLTHEPPDLVDALEQVINHGAGPQRRDGPPTEVTLGAGLAHGHLAAALSVMRQTGLLQMLGEPGRIRDLVVALVAARVCHPASKVAQAEWWKQTTLGPDLGLCDVKKDEAYAAMDWLGGRIPAVEKALAAEHLQDAGANPARLVLYDLTSTWVEGSCRELAAYGHSRDRKKGRKQVEFAIIAAPGCVRVGVRVFKGNTSDPTSFKDAVKAVRDEYQMTQAVMVGDRGMVTGARIDEIKGDEGTAGIGWIGALKHGPIAALAADDGPLRMTLFDQADLFSFTSPDYTGELLIACLNPFRRDADGAKRERLVQATLADLDKIGARVDRGTLKDPKAIEREVGKAIDRHKVAKPVNVQVAKGSISYGADRPRMAPEAAIDGVYVVRTSLKEEQMARADVVATYKRLAKAERDFKWLKSTDPQVRPVRHWLTGRVEAHLFIRVLAAFVEWRLREAWKPLTFADEEPPGPSSPPKPARRTKQADL
ncbi:MAG: IS1634 family transposase, partial [Bifidobacteriaceae bacterium]|nr:IS1634 family transposase [Bifidobacteriaceae bacterium]